MNLLLTCIHIEQSPRAVPLGAAMLASRLKMESLAGLRTEILNLYLDQSPSECAEAILGHAPDCVGFSVYVWNRHQTLQTVAILKEKKPDIIVLAGGPEVSADYDGIRKESSIDALIRGEGEENIVRAMRHLLQGGDPRGIPEIMTMSPRSCFFMWGMQSLER